MRVRSRTAVADDIIALELVSCDAKPLPRFEAGAHIDVRTKCGLIRQYSLCSNPVAHDHYRLGILLDPSSRGGSIAFAAHAFAMCWGGIPDHRDLVQSEDEKSSNAHIALCCSRSLSARIVVDV